MEEIKGLSFIQNKKYQHAIRRGYFCTYGDNPREWRHSFAGTYIWKHPQRTKVLDTFSGVVGHVPTWQDITDDNLQDLVNDLLDGSLATSSVRTMCAELKAVINRNLQRCSVTPSFAKILSVKTAVSLATYLTRDEIQRIRWYKPATELEAYVKRNFLIECLTGARKVDAERLTINNCNIDTGLLQYVPQKTPGITVSVPVHEKMRLRDLLSEHIERDCCTDVFNETLRRICRNCRIEQETTVSRQGKPVTAPKWQLVSSHTGRRSFATNLYLAGIALEDIALMMGHGKNVETTKRYICAERQLSNTVMAYFQ